MSTTAETTVEQDPREKPGDGRLKPIHHVVRIVVLPRAHGSRSASQKDGHDQSHGLTNGELEAAEEQLKKMDAPPSLDGTSARLGSSVAAFPKPNNMFEALKPTDIVVIGQEAASVRVVDAQDHTGAVRKPPTLAVHNDRNKDTVLRVWTESDTIEYQCDEPFEIVQVKKAGWEIYDAPDDPFGNSKDGYKAQHAEGKNERALWVWTSGLLPARANNQQYKMTFEIRGERVDPDVVCGDPPPR
jgi:hypothetical protein